LNDRVFDFLNSRKMITAYDELKGAILKPFSMVSSRISRVDLKSGAGALEVIIISVVLLAMALIFRKQIYTIFTNVSKDLADVGKSVDSLKFSSEVK
jgi:Flp pilus assembly pilin Flp